MKVEVNLGEGTKGWLKGSRQMGTVIKLVLDALVRVDLAYLSTHNVPELYRSGVRYQNEPKGTTEEFAAVPVVLSRGWGDCDDLAPWRVAELQKHGEKARLRIVWHKKPSGRLYHIVVRRENGRIEDPSAILGMPPGMR